jgi:hypothetical protein
MELFIYCTYRQLVYTEINTCEVEQNKGNVKKFFVAIYDNLHKKGLKRAEGV